jgi:hypothetical protein
MPFKYYIIYMKPLYRQNSHYIGKSTTSRLTYRLVTKSVPCRLDSTYRLENLVSGHIGLSVVVANGDRVASSGCCTNLKVFIAGDAFTIDCYELPLGSYDMVLGVQWLESLGPILWDF